MTTEWQDGNVITNTFMNQAQRRIEAVAHVEDPAYGAVGDGVTDDTAAIQHAFDSAETVIFRAGATYLTSSTLFLTKNGETQVVKKIIGNGATLNLAISAGSTNAALGTIAIGVAAAPTDTSASGEYSGWQGSIEHLNFVSSADIVMMYMYGSGGIMRNCNFTSSGTSVHGGFMGRNLINFTFDRCFFDMRSIMTDTTGSGSFATDANGDNIPSSFGVFIYPRWPGVTLLGQALVSAATAYPNDGVYLRNCILVGGYVCYMNMGGDSHSSQSVEGTEFAYCDTGMICNTVGTITNSWFENCLTYGLRTAAVSTPWHVGLIPQGLTVHSCSFSPHNTGTSTSIQLDAVAYNTSIINCSFLDSLVNVKSASATNNHLWLVGGYKLAGADDFSAATLKIHYQNWMEDATHKIPDDIHITTAGKGLRIKEGSNARMGVATLVGGTIAVANTSVTANSRIFVSRMALGGTAGDLSVAVVAATSFTITSSSATDTSVVAWFIMEPA